MVVTSVLQVLDENEREFIVNHIPAAEIRSHFVKNPNLFQSIVKGFQAKTLSDEKAREIVLKNLKKLFIQDFVESFIKKWLQQIEDDYTRNVFNHDYLTARILAVSSSVFADKIDLYFKLNNEDASKDTIMRFKEETDKLKTKKQTEAFEAEKKKMKQQLDESQSTYNLLSEEIQSLRNELSVEKQKRKETERKLNAAIEDHNVLVNELTKAKERLASSATQTSQMQDELTHLRTLARYADKESSNGYNDSYPYTSICSVRYDRNDKPWLFRLADIKDGVISQFHQNEQFPQSFENRDRLFWNDGPLAEGTIGVWNWNAVPNNSDPSTDYVTTSYNKYAGLIEVIELHGYSSFEEIAQYLISGSINEFSGRRILFTLPEVKGSINGLLCSEDDFEMQNGKATLKSSVFVLPHFSIKTTQIVRVSKKMRFYNRVSLGVPKSLYRIRKPNEVVKAVLLKRAKSAVLRQRGLTQKEAQHCQGFLNDICTDNLYSEIANAYGCTEKEASEYVAEFISQANINLTEGDLDLKTLSEAIYNNKELLMKCKDSIKTEWESENAETLKAAQMRLDTIQQTAVELERQSIAYKEELTELETRITSKTALAAEVEQKIIEKIADAKQNAADFIAEMAFAVPSNTLQVSNPTVEINITKRKIDYTASDEIISDIDTFEDCLEENLKSAGYERNSARNLTQTLTYCIFNNLPIVVSENADRIADCISAMFGEKGVNAIALPIGESNCMQLVNCINEHSETGKTVFLIDGLFDGFSLSKFNELMQHSFEFKESVLVLALNGVSGDMLPVSAWNRAVYVDGDIGIRNIYRGELYSYSSDEISYEDIDKEQFRKNYKSLKAFSAILGNTAIVNLARYMTQSGGTIQDNITVQLLLTISAKYSGKTEKLNELLDKADISLNEEIIDKYL